GTPSVSPSSTSNGLDWLATMQSSKHFQDEHSTTATKRPSSARVTSPPQPGRLPRRTASTSLTVRTTLLSPRRWRAKRQKCRYPSPSPSRARGSHCFLGGGRFSSKHCLQDLGSCY